MNSDDYFDDELDSTFLDELDAIEATALEPSAQPGQSKLHVLLVKPQSRTTNPLPVNNAPSSDYDEFDTTFDEEELQRIEAEHISWPGGSTQPAGTNKPLVQSKLDGGTIAPQLPKPKPLARSLELTKSVPRNQFGNKPPKTKRWDYAARAKSKQRKAMSDAKGKSKVDDDYGDVDLEDEEMYEFEQFPAPVDPVATTELPNRKMKLEPAADVCRDWLYPINRPRRDYQYNIAQKCLFDNTLVALPTGLGKTFIAGVVMLNYYRWFPEGKVVFVAPTKPLVAQQIDACLEVCGIPGRDAVELTGEHAGEKRTREWSEKRVFFMTPQTFRNDILVGRCDPLDVILLVVDEAHKATGDHSYAQVVRILMAKNPFFRVMALTATPGSTPAAVQSIVDALHISNIEIRDEESLDLRPYLFKKEVKLHDISMSESILKIQAPLIKLMESQMKRLKECGILHCHDVVMLHPYSCQTAMTTLSARRDFQQLKWAYAHLKTMQSLARAMGYLMEFSASMCCKVLKELAQGEKEAAKGTTGKATQSRLRGDPNFELLMHEVETQRLNGFPLHPKMDCLLGIAMEHFVPQGKVDERTMEGTEEVEQTRMMVFVTFRECVDEVVAALNRHQPLIRASRFVGQGKDKEGKKGIAQAEQTEVLRKFKSGVFNVLVSTSIGEEGLDIGEVDRIICYDASKTPIRTLQRIGRTGRKRTGYVHVLLAQGREDRNWQKSNDKYEEVQQSIVRGNQLELYGDVERLIPDHIRPVPLPKLMEIEPRVKELKQAKLSFGKNTEGKKRKRNDEVTRNIPLGAETGFVNVSKLVVKGAKTKKTRALKPIANASVEDDEDDLEIEAGVMGPPVFPSAPAARKAKKQKQPRVKKTAKKDNTSQVSTHLEYDSDDMEIEKGVRPSTPLASEPPATNAYSPISHSPVASHKSVPVVDLSSSDEFQPLRDAGPLSSPECPLVHRRLFRKATLHPSPGRPLLKSRPHDAPVVGSSPDRPLLIAASPGLRSQKKDYSWLTDDGSNSDDDSPDPRSSKTQTNGSGLQNGRQSNRPCSAEPGFRSPAIKDTDYSPIALPAPPEPSHSPIQLSPSQPSSSFPIRGAADRRRPTRKAVEFSSPLEMPPPSQIRLKRRPDRISPSPVKKRRASHRVLVKEHPLFDIEAEHSGDEVSARESECEVEESESDQRFLQELPETQMPSSYNQAAAYRFGLMTQAPSTARAPVFALRPKRTGTVAWRSRRQVVPTSSPERRQQEEPDEYDMGSFVVHDEEPLLYSDGSSDT